MCDALPVDSVIVPALLQKNTPYALPDDEFYQVEKEQVAEALELRLHDPGREPYLNKKGGYLYVSSIPKRKRAGRPAKRVEP